MRRTSLLSAVLAVLAVLAAAPLAAATPPEWRLSVGGAGGVLGALDLGLELRGPLGPGWAWHVDAGWTHTQYEPGADTLGIDILWLGAGARWAFARPLFADLALHAGYSPWFRLESGTTSTDLGNRKFIPRARVGLGAGLLGETLELRLFGDVYAPDTFSVGAALHLRFDGLFTTRSATRPDDPGRRIVRVRTNDTVRPVDNAPSVVIVSPEDGKTVAELSVAVTVEIVGADDALLEVRVNGRLLPFDKQRGVAYADEAKRARRTVIVPLTAGENRIAITAVDKKKNRASAPREVTVSCAGGEMTCRALVFGTDTYAHWGKLNNPVADARAIAAHLKADYGFQVELVENADQRTMLMKLREYAGKKYAKNDQLLVFFAGHGHFDNMTRLGYVVARDSGSVRDDPALTSYLSHGLIRDRTDRMDCRHVLTVYDVCFGGTFDDAIAMRGRADDEGYDEAHRMLFVARKLEPMTRRYLASGGKEQVADGRPGQHSPFAARFLEALEKGPGPDGILTLAGLMSWLEKLDPLPTAGGYGRNEKNGDFLFIRN